jgi:dienelactone hydrolase
MSLSALKTGRLPAILSMFLVACNCHVSAPHRINSIQTQGWLNLHNHPLQLHFSKPYSLENSDVLVVYSTGDGGWRGLGRQIYEWIATWHYPVVGFSSSDYLKNLGYISDTTTPRRLARDFKAIVQFAEQNLELQPSTRIILVGLSRGAGLSVVAAGQTELYNRLGGVVAIALTREEEHVVHYSHSRRSSPDQPKQELLQIQTYEYLPRITSVPVVVLQSTHDGYLPASEARVLFGPDTALKKLIPIEARNHGFSGGCLDLYREAETSMSWIHRNGKSGHP